MPKQLSYEDYYSEQMDFIDRYIRKDLKTDDNVRLRRIEQLQAQQSIYFLDEFLDIETDKALETTRIGYKPLEPAEYSPQQLALAPEASEIKPENRRLSRYRLIHGPVDFYLGTQLEDPIEIPVITTCAPNLMGSSKVDLNEFSTGGSNNRQLKADVYEKECLKLANYIVQAAKKEGHERLIMPAFGVGVYIRKLDHASKELARQAMYKAFADAAEKYKINIDWIVWKGDFNPDGSKTKLKSYAPDCTFMQPVIHDDMMLYAEECLQRNEKVVLLNPGSDRTIGGAYTHPHPKTLEEQMAQQSDLVFLHSEFNKPMVKKFRAEFLERKKMHKHSMHRVIQMESTAKLNLKDLAMQINSFLGINETTWISENNSNYKISFKKMEDARKFGNLLETNDIRGKNGKPKNIQLDHEYQVLYLTEPQLRRIPLLNAIQPEKNVTAAHNPLLPKISEDINVRLGVNEAPWISKNGINYIVSFKTEAAASEFRDLLHANNICGKGGNPKTVQKNNSYHVVYLTPGQLEQISSLDAKRRIVKDDLSAKSELKKLAQEIIHERLKIKEAPWISKKGMNYKISFKDEPAASQFKELLTLNDITGKGGKPKTVQKDGQYYVIYVTADQFQRIPSLETHKPGTREHHSLKFNLRTIAQIINGFIKIKESPRISAIGFNYKVSFKDQAAAASFKDLLTANNIVGKSGTPKTVQNYMQDGKQYFALYLTPAEFIQIPSLKEMQTIRKSHQNLQVDALILALNKYREERANFSGPNPEYKTTFFCIGLGFSKTEKFAAVDSLIKALTDQSEDLSPHLACLKNGELGKTICNALNQSGLFVDKEIKTVTELVNYLNEQRTNGLCL